MKYDKFPKEWALLPNKAKGRGRPARGPWKPITMRMSIPACDALEAIAEERGQTKTMVIERAVMAAFKEMTK